MIAEQESIKNAPPMSKGNGCFAPYPVWLMMRIVGIIGAAMALGWFFHAMYVLLNVTQGSNLKLLPGWIFIAGIAVAGGRWRKGDDTPPICEFLGAKLASKKCPDCEQSVFSSMPPTGYSSDVARHSFWPMRNCSNCGHDMTKRVASQSNMQ